MIGTILSNGLQGIQSSLKRAGELAARIASPNAIEASEDQFVSDVIELKQERNNLKANAIVIKTAEEMQDSLLDIIA